MKQGVAKHKPRYGHIMVMFGLFVSLITLTLQGVNAPHTIAFGTSEVASLSNQYRANAGLAALTLNSQLTSSAQAKANDMANNSYFAHDSPAGLSPWYFFDAAGYSYSTAGENLALTNQSASSVVDGWYNSPGHRANMLNTSFTEVGYGIAFVPSFTYNSTTYSDVYLVAAHYALPQTTTVAAAASPTPAPPATQPAPAPADTTAPAPEASPAPAEPVVEQKPEATADHPIVPATTDAENGTSTSGTLAAATTDQPKLPVKLAYVGLGIGTSLVVVGSLIEIRRFMRHLPLIPKLHH